MQRFMADRTVHIEELKKIRNLKVIPSQANYVMCEVLGGHTAKSLTELLLDKYNIFIKDLSTKDGIDGEYVRLAVRNTEDNLAIIRALNGILGN